MDQIAADVELLPTVRISFFVSKLPPGAHSAPDVLRSPPPSSDNCQGTKQQRPCIWYDRYTVFLQASPAAQAQNGRRPHTRGPFAHPDAPYSH